MRFSDETLIAFAEGVLDEPTRRAVERAIRDDPALAAKVRRHMAMRDEESRALGRTLHAPAPPHLRAVARGAKVVRLDSVRAAKKEVRDTVRGWSWPQWGAIGAAAACGVLAGAFGWAGVRGDVVLAMTAGDDGALSARGRLDAALSRPLASAPRAGVKVGISFIARDGRYCRTFALGSAAGLACRGGGQWKIPVLAEGGAAGAMPVAVLAAVEARAVGPSLDAKAEQAAAQRGWVR